MIFGWQESWRSRFLRALRLPDRKQGEWMPVAQSELPEEVTNRLAAIIRAAERRNSMLEMG